MKLSVKLGVVFLFVLTSATWGYELAYDDGEPEFMYTWEGYSIGENFLGAFAMRMTADSYPAEIYSVKFGFTRVPASPDVSSWNYFILGHDDATGNPDETNVVYESPDISTADMDVPEWPSFTWYQYDLPIYSPVEVSDDWWVVCHGNWFGAAANWYICVDETDGGVGRDRTKTATGWHPTSYILEWNGGDLLIRSVVEEPGIAVNAASFGRIKALYE